MCLQDARGEAWKEEEVYIPVLNVVPQSMLRDA